MPINLHPRVRDRSLALVPFQGPEDAPVSDQYLDAFVIVDDDGKPVGTIEDGDAVVLFNFRADRMVQISKAFEYADFKTFNRERFPQVGRARRWAVVTVRHWVTQG